VQTLIFEGIATSGKSTVIDYLVKSLKDEMTIELATEEQTHMPIMAQRNEPHTIFFENLINKLTLKHPDLLIFDRLYITQAYRTKSDLVEYTSIENTLMPHSPHTIILKVDEAAIAERVRAASEHREQKWLEYLKTKGNNFEEIAKDYTDQQRGLLQLVAQSKIPYTVFDTTNHGYGTIAEDIIRAIRT
jgi:thymidylate kinase